MKSKRIRYLALVMALAFALAALGGCAPKPEKALEGTASNDILTFLNNEANKPIIRIATQYYTPDNAIVDALQQEFPDYLFVIDQAPSAGTGAEKALFRLLSQGTDYDMIISGGNASLDDYKDDFFVDLSAESFLDAYLLSALQRSSVDGHIYEIPATSTLSGIAYNADMFRERGWVAPTNTDEFFALCEQIAATGIDPFTACFKYSVAVNTLLGMMCYDKLYKQPKDSVWFDELLMGKATYKGHMEPMYELAKRFYDTGVILPDYFSASLTKQRQAFWNGESAMINYDSAIYTYAETENAPFEIGFMPYPAQNSENSGFMITPEYYIGIPKTVEKDAERLALMKRVFAYISTPDGQNAMLKGSLRISSVKGVTLPESPARKYAQDAYDRGNLYPVVSYEGTDVPIQDLQKASIQTIYEGASVDEAIALMDESLSAAFQQKEPEPQYEKLATADKPFTMLETSYYIADKLREAAGTDVGLMINGGYFRSNLAVIEEGEISSDLSRYTMKGVSADDFLTEYKLTGAQLKEMLEHPIVNDVEIDALVAASGLKLEYAPWNERGSRVLKATLADGKPLEDGTLYTVAAWAGAIDPRYITETVKSFDALGTLNDILREAFARDGSISPDIADDVALVWPKAK